jgi:hypothetical protein
MKLKKFLIVGAMSLNLISMNSFALPNNTVEVHNSATHIVVPANVPHLQSHSSSNDDHNDLLMTSIFGIGILGSLFALRKLEKNDSKKFKP